MCWALCTGREHGRDCVLRLVTHPGVYVYHSISDFIRLRQRACVLTNYVGQMVAPPAVRTYVTSVRASVVLHGSVSSTYAYLWLSDSGTIGSVLWSCVHHSAASMNHLYACHLVYARMMQVLHAVPTPVVVVNTADDSWLGTRHGLVLLLQKIRLWTA